MSALLFFLNIVLTMSVSRRGEQPIPQFAEAISGPEEAPAFLDRIGVWVTIGVGLIILAYGPTVC